MCIVYMAQDLKCPQFSFHCDLQPFHLLQDEYLSSISVFNYHPEPFILLTSYIHMNCDILHPIDNVNVLFIFLATFFVSCRYIEPRL